MTTDDAAHNMLMQAVGALAAMPARMFTIERDSLRPGTRILVEVLSNNTIRFSLDGGVPQ